MLFLGACLGVVVAAACGGMMGTLRSETNRRRAGSFYQSGSLAFGGVAVFLLVTLAPRLSLGALGWIVAALIVLPALAALAAPAQAASERAEPAGNGGAHLERIQVHVPALGGDSLHAADYGSLLQRRHDRPAAGAGARLRRERRAGGVDERRWAARC